MKKLIVLSSIAMMAAAANAEFVWSWWTGDGNADRKIQGCYMGLATECAEAKGAQIALCYSLADKVKNGVQYAVGYSRVDTLRNGAQVGCVCRAQKASLQFGLWCMNETGFVKGFPFFNFTKGMFGPEN